MTPVGGITTVRHMFTDDIDPRLFSAIAAAAGRSVLVSTARAASVPAPELLPPRPPLTPTTEAAATNGLRLADFTEEAPPRSLPSPPSEQVAAPLPVVVAEGQTSSMLDLHRSVTDKWKTDPAVRAEFPGFGTYLEHRKTEHCRRLGISRAEFEAQYADAGAVIATLEQRGPISEGDKAAIYRCSADWTDSAEIRSEFGTFAAYAAFTRAKAAGRVRIYGQR